MAKTKYFTALIFLSLTINDSIAQELCNKNNVICFDKTLKEQSSKVDSAYNQALKSLPANKKVLLERSQTAWTTFMTENCKAYVASKPANDNKVISYECSLSAMKKREVELREKLCTDPVTNCPEI